MVFTILGQESRRQNKQIEDRRKYERIRDEPRFS